MQIHRALLLIGIMLGSFGSLSAADLWYASNDALMQVDGSGNLAVGTLPGGAVGIATAADGGVWVASRDEARLRRFDAQGALVLDLATAAPLQGLAVAIDGSLYATRPTLNDLWHVAADGSDLGSTPVGNVPYGVAIDRTGVVWVANSFGNSVTRFEPTTGTAVEIAVGFFPSHLVAAPNGTIWIAEKESVRQLAADGALIQAIPAGGFPLGITVARSGEVWVANQNSHDVSVYSASGALLQTIPTGWKPRGIAAAGDGSVFVLCRLSDEVLRFAADGTWLETHPATYPDGLGDLTGLTRALSVDPLGDADQDGTSNAIEANLGFDPLDASSSPTTFVRGDADRNGSVEFVDAFRALEELFGIGSGAGAGSHPCPESLDVNDDGTLDLADPVYLLGFLGGAGPAPFAPFPSAGVDPYPALGYPCLD